LADLLAYIRYLSELPRGEIHYQTNKRELDLIIVERELQVERRLLAINKRYHLDRKEDIGKNDNQFSAGNLIKKRLSARLQSL